MPIAIMAFNPASGLRDMAQFPTVPANEAAAREQVQGRMDELRDYINSNVQPNINTKLRNLMGVVFSG